MSDDALQSEPNRGDTEGRGDTDGSGSAGDRPAFGLGDTETELTPEQQEQAKAMARELAETRKALLDTEAATVIANHGFGLFELAAIHITTEDPDLVEARLAVDALAALVEGLEGRLGEQEESLVEALSQIRLAFVQRVHALKQAEEASADGSAAEEQAPGDES